jgi:hypothetical protein
MEYTVDFSKEEKYAIETQLICRLDALEDLLIVEAKNKNIPRVLELSKYIEVIRGFFNRLRDADKCDID